MAFFWIYLFLKIILLRFWWLHLKKLKTNNTVIYCFTQYSLGIIIISTSLLSLHSCNRGVSIACTYLYSISIWFCPLNFWSSLRDTYCTRAIISRGFYRCYFIFHCGIYCGVVIITDNFEQGNSSIKSAVYNQEQVIIVCVRYLFSNIVSTFFIEEVDAWWPVSNSFAISCSLLVE